MSRTVQVLRLLAAERIAKTSIIESEPPPPTDFVSRVEPAVPEEKGVEEELPERRTAS